jgi:hypothetical protein|tara:strand:+ start:1169 stop:1507 length:339 start_codon:yes stop_codon:yes gene_type:complete
MAEKMCHWCEVTVATSGLKNGERYCKNCDPYAWASFLHPDTYEENKRIALMRVERKLAKAEAELVDSQWEQAINERENTDRKDLLAARVAFGVMFLIVLVAIAGIYVVGGKC